MDTLLFRHRRVFALVVLIIVSVGSSALLTIGRQEDPSITNLFATVTTPYPGASPARVEALVTEKIEEELREISEILEGMGLQFGSDITPYMTEPDEAAQQQQQR